MMKVADPALVRDKGFSLLDMKRYARAVGMAAEGYQVEYDALRDLKVPAIALLNMRGYKHFVVIRKADASHVYVGDPALGNRVMTKVQFERSWNRVLFVMTGKGFDPNTALLNPPPPLSARRLYGERSPVFNADPAEFGFGPAFSFRF
jgi:predicted double-glycine peptidase